MKKGFTLIELLVVIVIVAVVSVGATISFSNIDDDTSKKELLNMYKDIQRGAGLYLDLHQAALDQLISEGRVTLKINTLQDENFISRDLTNPINGESIDNTSSVVLYIKTDESSGNEYVDSCVVNFKGDGTKTCIANSNGENCGCCDYGPSC